MKVKKYQSPSGSLPRRRLKFTPEQVALFESSFLNKGTNNSGGQKLKEEGVLALQHLELKKREEEARIRSRSERPHVLKKRKATLPERLRGGRDEYELTTQVIGMSGRDPLLGTIFDLYVGGKGAESLFKSGSWLYNNGKIILKSIPYNSENFYRAVSKDAIKDAQKSGIIRSSSKEYLYNPYFSHGRLFWTGERVIEGRQGPVLWVKAKGPNGEYSLDDVIKSGEKNLSSGYVPTEVFPYSNGSTQVSTKGFSYWKKHPIVGWREYKFKQEGKMNTLLFLQKGKPITINRTLPNVVVVPQRLYLDTYYPVVSEFPFTGHSAIDAYSKKNLEYDEVNDEAYYESDYATIDKMTKDAGYNLVTNNCADATRCALEAISGKKMNPNLFTTPGDVLDFFKENFDVVKDKRKSKFGNPVYYTTISRADFEKVKKLQELQLSLNRLRDLERNKIKKLLLALNMQQRIRNNKKYKEGSKISTLLFLKNGSGIHIKKKNRGKFTDYCGGLVTQECINKGKHSSNPAIRKRATFADNARKWKHKEGGLIQKLQLGNYFMKPIKWLAHLINDYGNTKLSSYPTGTAFVYAISDERKRHPELTYQQAAEKVQKLYNQNRKNIGLPTETTPSLSAAGLAVTGGVFSPWFAVPDIIFDASASIDEPSTSNNLHTIADFPETVAKFTPSKIDDYVAKGVLTLGNIDDALSAGGKNLFEIFNGSRGRINNIVDKASVRESTRTNSPKRTKSIKIKKSGGKAFVEGVNVLDSNPKAYKYVKKKYKMRSAGEGTKVNWGTKIYNALNSDLGKSITGLVVNGAKTMLANNELNKALAANDLNLNKKYDPNNFIDEQAIWNEVDLRMLQLLLDNPEIHYGEIDRLLMYLMIRRGAFDRAKLLADYLKAIEKLEYDKYINNLKSLGTASLLDNISGTISGIGNYLGNKYLLKNAPTTAGVKTSLNNAPTISAHENLAHA